LIFSLCWMMYPSEASKAVWLGFHRILDVDAVQQPLGDDNVHIASYGEAKDGELAAQPRGCGAALAGMIWISMFGRLLRWITRLDSPDGPAWSL